MLDLSSVPTSYFTKRAKDLLAGVRAGRPSEVNRVRPVFTDTSLQSDHDLAASFGLMRAQHVVAVEHGFTTWKALSEASGVEARLAITMAHHPELNDFGIGIYFGHSDKSMAEQRTITANNRRTLRNSVAAVSATVTWLRENIQPTRTINRRHSSYGLKHVAEGDIGYVTNGVFIAAGIIAGYPFEFVPGSPNVDFGVSERSLKVIATRRNSPQRVLRTFGQRGVELLASRGVQAFPIDRSKTELAWLDDGDVRTLTIQAIETKPFIVRLFVDHYTLLVSQRVGKALGIAPITVGSRFARVRPVRPKAEISVLMDEVESALEWALNIDSRVTTKVPPPFEKTGSDTWSYVWSKRASERSAARRAAS